MINAFKMILNIKISNLSIYCYVVNQWPQIEIDHCFLIRRIIRECDASVYFL